MTEKDPANQVPRIRYLTQREMLGLMGSTAAALTLAGCGGGGGEQSGSGSGSGGQTTGAAGAGTTAETASTTCVVKPEQTEGPYYVDTGLERSDIREEREGIPFELTFNVSRIDQGDISVCGSLPALWWTSGIATLWASTRASRITPPVTSTTRGRRSCAGTS
ncbi:MAG TPA: hypothetical protein VK359_06695 [Rubrobacteraceae bacterium]|jgi:hypothetical protein|nr:hypothetical protein [Rubrobacteraceae bacterium]